MANKKHENAAEGRGGAKSAGGQQKTAADFDRTVREAEKESPRTAKPGSSGGDRSKQHNNGRGGGK